MVKTYAADIKLAVRWTGKNLKEVKDFLGKAYRGLDKDTIIVRDRIGYDGCAKGSWVLKDHPKYKGMTSRYIMVRSPNEFKFSWQLLDKS